MNSVVVYHNDGRKQTVYRTGSIKGVKNLARRMAWLAEDFNLPIQVCIQEEVPLGLKVFRVTTWDHSKSLSRPEPPQQTA